ncbi:MAG TPA: flagellar filament capping protein FliD [Gammaproteobacteria bacterium]|nr:flagellar filament capping protein FliD [Gammaproteobacteria bacterium]
MTSTSGSGSLGITPPLSQLGVGSGMNLQGIVQKLMSAQSQPLQRLQKTESGYQTQLSGYGKLSSALSTFENAMQGFSQASQFQAYTAGSSDNNVLTATADSSATPNNYQLSVSTLAQARTDVSQGYASAATVGSSGDQATITVGGKSETVTIGGKTLQQIADAINQSSSNPGVTAAVVNNGASSNPYELMLTSNKPGTANGFSLSFTNGSGSSITDPLAMSTTQAAQNAAFTVNGASLSSSTNTVTGVLPGVTLNLNGTTASGGTVTLAVAQDQKGIAKNVQQFVKAYNTLHSAISGTQTGNGTTDSTLRMMGSQLDNVMNSPISGASGSYSYLAQVGVSIQKDGSLSVNTRTLDQALSADPNGTAQLFAQYASKLNNMAQQMAGPNGLVQARTQSLNNDISNVQGQIAHEQHYLSSYRQNLVHQYSALDQLLGSMKNTRSYLAKQLASLPGG